MRGSEDIPNTSTCSAAPVLPRIKSTTSIQETSGIISTSDVLGVTGSTIDQSAETTPTRPDWSIAYNQEIEKIIEIQPVRTISHPTRVYLAKFSNDGQSLAVVHLCSQVVTIYRVSTGTKIWQVLQLFLLAGSIHLGISLLEDLYVKETTVTSHVNFSPDDRYLATSSLEAIRVSPPNFPFRV
jgi:WD40 repeat protein